LKVVKTLYESSTFTQLGKTVGSALGQQLLVDSSEEEEGEGEMTAHSRQGIERSQTDEIQVTRPSMFSALCVGEGKAGDKKSGSSLMEKVFGCNFLLGHDVDDELSEEDTFGNGTFDEEHTIQNSTFDSVSDDGYKKHPRGSSSRRHR
jgi:hypothetical protein